MNSPAKKSRKNRPIGFLLPALVFGTGIVAISLGVPKQLAVWRLSSSGEVAQTRIVAIQHGAKQQILTLSFDVKRTQYTTDVQVDPKDDTHTKWNFPVTYLPNNPGVATANLDADKKIANEYVLAGVLEFCVGGWILFVALRQRARWLIEARGLANKPKD